MKEKKGLCLSPYNRRERIHRKKPYKVLPVRPMRRFLLHCTCLCFLTLLNWTGAWSAEISELLRNRIEAGAGSAHLVVGTEVLYSADALLLFYERRGYRAAWSGESGLMPQAYALMEAIERSDEEGLNPDKYHRAALEKMFSGFDQGNDRSGSKQTVVDADLLLTDAFLIYASHLWSGSVIPETIDPEWYANRRESDLAAVLESALAGGDVQETLQWLLPSGKGYGALKKALRSYRQIKDHGGWPAVSEGPKLEKGMQEERVRKLRTRLIITGDVPPREGAGGDYFDEALDGGVRRFQRRHGLDVDGVAGRQTFKAVNITVEQRIRHILVNLERWRWLPQDLGDRYLIVNIAGFELDVFEEQEQVLRMPVIVGKEYRRTPVFSDTITYLVLNPSWNVPPSIAVEDTLPLIQDDPTYLIEHKIKVYQGWGADAEEIDPLSVDWKKVTDRNFPYRFRQEPGTQNALGRIKFMFPNKYNVYLHDTPARELFNKTTRAYSSGCIRIQKPLELAEYLLGSDPQWTRDKIEGILESNVEQTVKLKEPIPIHLQYWTVWVDANGMVQFREDLYDRDQRLENALFSKTPELVDEQ